MHIANSLLHTDPQDQQHAETGKMANSVPCLAINLQEEQSKIPCFSNIATRENCIVLL